MEYAYSGFSVVPDSIPYGTIDAGIYGETLFVFVLIALSSIEEI